MKQPEPFGKFLLYGQVAVGGMAEIYKARYADPSMPQMDIALKRILPSYTEDESFVTMFKDEGNIAMRLKHPNIVTVYEVGEVNNDWYIAMEFIVGSDLRVLGDACEKYNKRFTNTQIARIICETAKALDYAHACTDANGMPLNIVHRDCTPHNIMVSHDNTIRLMDFGIAKAASRATKTRVGTVKGKSSYMSPEQARGKQLDGRSDMFTLGTVAWEMLTGYRLFKASSDFEILTKVLKSTIIHPSELDSNVPTDLGDIIMKTLERDRDLRYPACGALAEALESWLSVNGDGSDAKLGEVCMALTNKKGHSITELPDYVPGASLFKCEDGVFIPVSNGPRNTMAMPPVNGTGGNSGAAQPSQTAPQAPSMQFSQPGFPAPGMVVQPTTNRVPTWYIVAYVILFIGIVLCVVGAVIKSNAEVPDSPTFSLPESFVTYKIDDSSSVAATVSVNGKKIVDDKGEFLETPIYDKVKRHVGDKLVVKFEKEGYEPVTVERNILFAQQHIIVKMISESEAKLAKTKIVPELLIETDPVGAIVTVNGKEEGASPVTIKNIKFTEKLDISASLENYDNASAVYIASAYSDSKVKLRLDEEKKVSKSHARVHHRPSPSAKKIASGKGKIKIKAVPWGMVELDGKRKKNATQSSPLTVTVPSGSHKVTIKLPTKRLSKSKNVTVKPDQTVTVGYDFNADKWM